MIYCYYIANNLASLHKIKDDGDDYDEKPIKIGRFNTDAQAKDACLKHYEKACKMAKAANRNEPKIMWV